MRRQRVYDMYNARGIVWRRKTNGPHEKKNERTKVSSDDFILFYPRKTKHDEYDGDARTHIHPATKKRVKSLTFRKYCSIIIAVQ